MLNQGCRQIFSLGGEEALPPRHLRPREPVERYPDQPCWGHDGGEKLPASETVYRDLQELLLAISGLSVAPATENDSRPPSTASKSSPLKPHRRLHREAIPVWYLGYYAIEWYAALFKKTFPPEPPKDGMTLLAI